MRYPKILAALAVSFAQISFAQDPECTPIPGFLQDGDFELIGQPPSVSPAWEPYASDELESSFPAMRTSGSSTYANWFIKPVAPNSDEYLAPMANIEQRFCLPAGNFTVHVSAGVMDDGKPHDGSYNTLIKPPNDGDVIELHGADFCTYSTCTSNGATLNGHDVIYYDFYADFQAEVAGTYGLFIDIYLPAKHDVFWTGRKYGDLYGSGHSGVLFSEIGIIEA